MAMAEVLSRLRVSVDGKFFRLGEKKFYVKGVAYGPFGPGPSGDPPSLRYGAASHGLQTTGNRLRTTDHGPRRAADGPSEAAAQQARYKTASSPQSSPPASIGSGQASEREKRKQAGWFGGTRAADLPGEAPALADRSGFASPEQTARDFAQIGELGANVVRVYEAPEKWFLDLAAEHGLKVFVGIPWNEHLCFMDSAAGRTSARQAVRDGVIRCGRHPAIFAYSVANEIPADIVRWSGASRVADFIDELVLEAKGADPECLCTFTNFPTTEFLRPQSVDFVCFNVYLHQRQAFRNYLARLQMQAADKPLLLGELGMDSLREGEERKCEMLGWQIE